MHTNNSNSLNLYDLYATFCQKFSEQKHETLALWLETIIRALESQGFSLGDILFALSEVLHERGFKQASTFLEQASTAVFEQSKEIKNDGRD